MTALAHTSTRTDLDALEEVSVQPRQSLPAPNPAQGLYPVMFPVEIALRERPVHEICRIYKISREEFREIWGQPRFQSELQAAREMLQRQGMTFRHKAGAVAEEFLKKAYDMVMKDPHDAVAPGVKKDLILGIMRVSGNDASAAMSVNGGGGGNALNVQIVFASPSP